ncbi:MAG TPA: hypothetical protein VFG30_12725 [Polyangiales bacterium]|nr:hypothetical protein [Polyangiales bacterium]
MHIRVRPAARAFRWAHQFAIGITTAIACATASGCDSEDAMSERPAIVESDAAAIEETTPEQPAVTASDPAPILEPASARTSLVESSAWQAMSAADDPFADRPEDAACPDDAYMPEFLSEESVFSVDTGGCTYLTARQRSLRHVVAGEKLVLRVWHFALHANESAMAHVAVRIDEKTLLDTTVPIPAAGGLLNIEEVAPESIPEGATPHKRRVRPVPLHRRRQVPPHPP